MRRALAVLVLLALTLLSMSSDAALLLKAHGGFKPTTHFFLLNAGGHFLLNSGGALLCNTC